MSSRFFSLFSSNKGVRDTLSQEQREAIVDALYFSMYADNHLAFAEDKVIDDWAAALSWDAQLSLQEYEGRSIALIRRTKDDSGLRAEFLAGLGKRLGDEKTKALTLGLCKKLISVDGQLAEPEESALSELKKAIGAR